jgi:hypothetical protein
MGVAESDVVMVAHYESYHDHVLLLKTMMNWGMQMPPWSFSDSLPIFKLVVAPSEPAKLISLVFTYVPWFMHIEHDASSDADALKAVLMDGITGWEAACCTFSAT